MYRRIIKTIVSALFIVPVLFSCKDNGKYLSIGKPIFIREFPATGEMREIEDFQLDEFSLRAIKVVDTLLFVDKWNFVNTENGWAVYSLDGKRKYGECMRVGQGPGEFISYVPYVNDCFFTHEGDSLFVYAPSNPRNTVFKLNITRFLNDNDVIPYSVMESKYISSNSWATIPCGNGRVLLNRANDYFTGLNHLMYENDTVHQLPITREIDEITVGKGGNHEDVNIIGSVIHYNAAADKFVETMVDFNQINIYSADGTEGKTICVGKKLDDIRHVEQTPRESRRRAYMTSAAWDEGFGAIYIGDLWPLEDQPGKSQIQFFDWEGNPKYLVELPYIVFAFDINFKNNVLYVIHQSEDRLIAYDATEIVRSLRN